MSYEQPTRDELAYHEAGHAYAFAALVRFEEPVELGLGVDAQGMPTGWCRRTSLTLAGERAESVPPGVLPHLRYQSQAEVVIAMAGPAAEFRRRHRSRGAGLRALLARDGDVLEPSNENCDGDFGRVRRVVDALEPVDDRAFLRDLVRIADEIVATDWHRIGLLARRLAAGGVLGETALVEWFGRHPATPCRGIPISMPISVGNGECPSEDERRRI